MSWKPVFFDPTSQRGRWLSGLTVFGALAGSLLAAAFAYGVLILPELPELSKLNARQLFAIPVANPAPAPRIELRTVQTKVIDAPVQRSESPGRRRRTGNRPGRLHPAAHLRSHVVERVVTERDYPLLMPASTAAMRAPAAADQRTVPLSIGFYVSGDEESYLSLEEALPKLDWVAPTWLTLKDTSENLETRIDQAALDLVRKTRPSVKIVPLLQNLTEGAWDGPAAARQLANPISRGVLIDRIVSFLGANGLDGAIVDLEALPKSAQPDLVRFLDELHHEFAPRGWLAVVAVPLADAAANDTALAQSTDYTVLMASTSMMPRAGRVPSPRRIGMCATWRHICSGSIRPIRSWHLGALVTIGAAPALRKPCRSATPSSRLANRNPALPLTTNR